MKKNLMVAAISLSLTVFFSCTKDVEEHTADEFIFPISGISTPAFEQISFERFQLQEAPETLPFLEGFIHSDNIGGSSKSKKGRFKIRKEKIKKLTIGAATSYTFFIETDNESETRFENLVIRKIDNEYTYFRVTYSGSPEVHPEVPYEAHFNEVPEDSLDMNILTKYSNTRISSKGGCPAVYYLRCSVGGDANGHAPQLQSNGSYCSGSPTVYDFGLCSNDGGGGGGDNDDGPLPTQSGGGGGAGGSSPTPTGPATSPTNRDDLEDTSEIYKQKRRTVDALGLRLKSYQINFLVHNMSVTYLLRSFLNEHNRSTEAKDFALTAVDVIYTKGEVDFTDHLKGYDFRAETAEFKAFENDYRGRMSTSERTLFDSLSRFQQLDYLHSGYLAQTYAKIYFEDIPKVQYNGKGDAYRHALWNALAAAKLGASLTKRLTDAHENKPFDYSYQFKENQMDLYNNEVGRDIGSDDIFMLMMKVKFSADKGRLRYLSNTTPRATSSSQLTPTNR